MGLTGLELVISPLSGARSSQLSYRPARAALPRLGWRVYEDAMEVTRRGIASPLGKQREHELRTLPSGAREPEVAACCPRQAA